MRERGLVSEKFVLFAINEGDLHMPSKSVKSAIRNLVIDFPDQTAVGRERARKFVDYLKSKKIKVNMN